MSRKEIDSHFAKINELIVEIQDIVPDGSYKMVKFRADLAGLLVVAITATYENCVKEILCEYANKKHVAFGKFATRNFEKLNSKIRINDLERYCSIFDPDIKIRFRKNLARTKSKILNRVGKNIEDSYMQLLAWRHAFAHAHIQQTTIEEAVSYFVLSKRIIYILDDAFNDE